MISTVWPLVRFSLLFEIIWLNTDCSLLFTRVVPGETGTSALTERNWTAASNFNVEPNLSEVHFDVHYFTYMQIYQVRI